MVTMKLDKERKLVNDIASNPHDLTFNSGRKCLRAIEDA